MTSPASSILGIAYFPAYCLLLACIVYIRNIINYNIIYIAKLIKGLIKFRPKRRAGRVEIGGPAPSVESLSRVISLLREIPTCTAEGVTTE
jgi:hypothetical protein